VYHIVIVPSCPFTTQSNDQCAL